MRKYEEWFSEFIEKKTEVSSRGLSESFSVHSIRRFLEGTTKIWEIAFRYTGRLVVRSGEIGADGITIEWDQWTTLHDVVVPADRK